MSWNCAICGATHNINGAVVDAVCHHCGRLLCKRHQIITRDGAFSHGRKPKPYAVHCQDCKHSSSLRSSEIREGVS